MSNSENGLLDAYRKQCAHAVDHGLSAWGVYLMWRGQAGVTDDDLIDIAKELDPIGAKYDALFSDGLSPLDDPAPSDEAAREVRKELAQERRARSRARYSTTEG